MSSWNSGQQRSTGGALDLDRHVQLSTLSFECRLSDDVSRMLIKPCDENGRDCCTSGELEGRSEL